MKKKKWAFVWLGISFSLGVFALAGLIFTPLAIDSSPTGEVVPSEQYFSSPEGSGILYLSDDGSGALIYLNFEQKTTAVNLFLDNAEKRALLTGYEINYTILGSDDFLCNLCDRLGGIELDENGISLRFNGTSLSEKLGKSNTLYDMAEISEGFFKKFSKIGFTNNDFKFIIENTDTDLNFPVCYSWREVLGDTISVYFFENVFDNN